MRALVPTVVPRISVSICSGSIPAESRALTIARSGAPGIEETLDRYHFDVAVSMATKSVNVPPVSMPTLIATESSLHNVVRSNRHKSVHSPAHRKAALPRLWLRPTRAERSSFHRRNNARFALENNRSVALWLPSHPLQSFTF